MLKVKFRRVSEKIPATMLESAIRSSLNSRTKCDFGVFSVRLFSKEPMTQPDPPAAGVSLQRLVGEI